MMMRSIAGCSVSLLALVAAIPASAQTSPPTAPASATEDDGIQDIVVTAQRQAEPLQQVPIAVSAFSAENLKQQQINTSSDLQLTLPNITFTKTNFTSSSFTIRGIGDLCTGVTCDAATAVHINDVPILNSRIFENEYLDLERVEVLRGPQGTLYGRNATSGVVNFVTAKPNLSGFEASGEGEYGNFDSIRVKGMVNVPLGDMFGVRLTGYYLKRDGLTQNLFTGNRIDGRDQYGLRGTIRFKPGPDTTIDLMAGYFRERDNRSRVQKQLCDRDPTGVLGCLPDRLDFETTNGNSTLAHILTTREFFTAAGASALVPFALGSVYQPQDVFFDVNPPRDFRTVRIDFEPTYYSREENYLGALKHDFGPVQLSVTGGYTLATVESRTDYNLAVENSYAANPGLNTLSVAAGPGGPFAALFGNVRNALIPNGAQGQLCQSEPDPLGRGVYGGVSRCAATSLDSDLSNLTTRQWTVEGHIDSKFDGAFNFLLGGIYLKSITRDNSYYVNSFGLDYAAGLLGAARTNGAAYLATPFYRNESAYFRLSSYGLFGEGYLDISDRLKLTVGARLNHDEKFVRARTTLASFPAPFGTNNAYTSPFIGAFDADPNTAGNQAFADDDVSFTRVTGRAVIDYQITPRNLLYASYSRGYKSGGINPPLSFAGVATTFDPEQVDAFEIGSKNTLLDGSLRLNATAFYYKYKDLQLSRIVARTSVNDNVSADIWGVEAEAVIRPVRAVLVNLSVSYLDTKITADRFLPNPQDPSGGRGDAVIIKDITNASNCAVGANNGSVAAVNGFVNAVNQFLSLRPATAVPGTNTTGAFSICGVLQAAAAGNIGAASAALALANPALGGLTPQQFLNLTFTGSTTGALPFTYYESGVPVNIRGNQLPQAPRYKFSAGIQYTIGDRSGWNVVPRFDLAYTGDYYGSVFNRPINRIQGYLIMNAQVQVNGPDDRFFVRGFVQNIENNNAITGLYVTDQSSGLFTNAFTLEPRRYGIAAGFRF